MIVKKLRLQKGWSQDQLSQLSGLSIRTIQRIEKGQHPGLESLKSLASVFEISITDLQEDSKMDTPETKINEPDAKSTLKVSIEERLAFEKVRRIKRFYSSIIRFCLVIPVLFIINLMTYPDYIWAVWPMLGWGMGLAFAAMRAFGLIKWFGPEWEKQQVEKYLGRKL